MPLWIDSDNLVIDASQNVVECDDCPCPAGCPCDDETMPAFFEVDANDEIGNATCSDCTTTLNSRTIPKLGNCDYSTVAFPTSCLGTDNVDIHLDFTGNLTVRFRVLRTDNKAVIAEYERTFAAGTICNQSHTLDKVSGDGSCNWPATIVVSPV